MTMKHRVICVILIAALLAGVAVTGASTSDTEPPAADLVAVVVRPTDIDQKGHVNNARYLEYLQVGRWHWLESHGLSNDALERDESTTLVVVNVNIDYRRAIRYGDEIAVVTMATKKSDKVIVFKQCIRGKGKNIYADATVTVVTVDVKTKKSRPMPASLERLMDTLQ